MNSNTHDRMFNGMLLGNVVFIGAIVAGGLVAAYLAWHNLPEVGGEWWFYIRAAATIVGGVIGVKLGALVGYVLAMIVLAISSWGSEL